MTTLKRILLAEDDENDIELTLAALDEKNLASRVDVVHDGVEVLDYLYCRGKYITRTTGNPVVLMLDLKMPKLDGMDVLQEIKSHEQLKSIPVVVLTSSRQEQDLAESYRLGANAYVVKPVGFAEFVTTIEELSFFWAVLNEPPPNHMNKINP